VPQRSTREAIQRQFPKADLSTKKEVGPRGASSRCSLIRVDSSSINPSTHIVQHRPSGILLWHRTLPRHFDPPFAFPFRTGHAPAADRQIPRGGPCSVTTQPGPTMPHVALIVMSVVVVASTIVAFKHLYDEEIKPAWQAHRSRMEEPHRAPEPEQAEASGVAASGRGSEMTELRRRRPPPPVRRPQAPATTGLIMRTAGRAADRSGDRALAGIATPSSIYPLALPRQSRFSAQKQHHLLRRCVHGCQRWK
jgi:hypothetical protein